MTTDKKLKQAVRARMTRTGERYAAARRALLRTDLRPAAAEPSRILGLLPGYTRIGGSIADISPLANALAAAGVRAPHTGEPYSEALLFGLGGGVGGGYFMFQFTGTPTVAVVGTRHLWQDPPAFLRSALGRIGVDPIVFESTGRRTADAALDEVLTAGRPALAWADRASLPHHLLPAEMRKYFFHVVGVAGREPASGHLLLDDRAPTPFLMDTAAFNEARGVITSMRRRLMSFDGRVRDVDLTAAVREAIRDGHRERTQPPIRNFGLPALGKWADQVASEKDAKGWPRTLPPGRDLLWALSWAFGSIETAGTDGAAHRLLQAEFLDEAAAIVGDGALRDAARRYRSLADAWGDLAEALLPDSVEPLRRTRELERERWELYDTRGADALDELGELARQQQELEEAIVADFPMTDAQRLDMFASIAERVRAIHALELEASEASVAAVA